MYTALTSHPYSLHFNYTASGGTQDSLLAEQLVSLAIPKTSAVCSILTRAGWAALEIQLMAAWFLGKPPKKAIASAHLWAGTSSSLSFILNMSILEKP